MKILFFLGLLVSEIFAGNLQGIRFQDEVKVVGDLKPEVDIKQGILEGSADVSRNGRLFFSFKDIPFGKVVKRFDMAVPADAWKGTRQAKQYGLGCAQVSLFTKVFKGQEDCLTLDVFVPKTETTPTEGLPVMVYIYGGAFVIGESSSYRPHYFMDEDVIIVVINYRVGPLGFFNAGIKGASGNQGLKDAVLALKWVQTNILSFGGDPRKVTIFGESAGGAAVAALIVSPMAKGLFSGAIAQSVVSISPITVFPDPTHEEAKKLAQAVDCPTSNAEYMVECLRKIKPDVLSKAATFNDPVWFDRINAAVVSPTIETFQESENDPNVFLSQNVETLLKEGKFNKVPLLVGFTSHEGLGLHAAGILSNPNITKRMNEQWGRILPQALFYWNVARDPCVVSSKLKNTYFQGKPVSMDTVDGLVKMYSEFAFQYPVRKIGLLHSEFAPVYFYNFTKHVKSSYVDLIGWKSANPASKPPAHGDDMQFLFDGTNFYPPVPKDSAEYQFSINFVKLFASFARNGKPTHFWGSKLTSPDQIQSVNSTDARHTWLAIDDELNVVPEPDDFVERVNIIEEIRAKDFDLPA